MCVRRPLSLGKIKLITFDASGTLIRFRKPPFQVYAEIGVNNGVFADVQQLAKAFKGQWVELTRDQPHFGTCWRSWWTQFVVRTFQNAGAKGNTTEENLRMVAAELIQRFITSEFYQAKEGAVELLTSLRNIQRSIARTGKDGENFQNSGFQLGVISNFDSRLPQILQATQLRHYFDWVITSHGCQRSKPQREIFATALSKANQLHGAKNVLHPNEALHVGDNYKLDFKGARDSNWHALLVASPQDRSGISDHVLRENPSVVFSDLEQLRSYLTNST